MTELKARRLIMEAGEDDYSRTVTLQMAFRGFECKATSTIEIEFEKFWKKVKEELQLQDFPEEEVEEEALKRP